MRLFHIPLLRVVMRRLLMSIPLLFIVSILSFLLLSLTPGDAAERILGLDATPQALAALRHTLGLDRPLWGQYWYWLRHALNGDLGTSVATGQPVTQAMVQRLPVTLSLVAGCLIVMPTLGIASGLYSAVRGGVLSRCVDFFSLVGFALPGFWLASIMVEIFAVKIHLFPAIGYVSLAHSPTKWLRSITLPVLAMSIGGIAVFAKQAREAMLDVLASEHIRMAWARGVPARAIFFRFALKNVGTIMLTLVGLLTIGLIGGTAFVETIFELPGLGGYAVTGAQQQDVPVVQATVVVFTLIIVVVNLITDLAYSWLDPRVRTS